MIFASTFAFVFVTLTVAGFRALDIIRAAKEAKANERKPEITHYVGPVYDPRDDY